MTCQSVAFGKRTSVHPVRGFIVSKDSRPDIIINTLEAFTCRWKGYVLSIRWRNKDVITRAFLGAR